jgi:hypothetical protein
MSRPMSHAAHSDDFLFDSPERNPAIASLPVTHQTQDHKVVTGLYSPDELSFLPTVSASHIKGSSANEYHFKSFIQRNPFGTITHDTVRSCLSVTLTSPLVLEPIDAHIIVIQAEGYAEDAEGNASPEHSDRESESMTGTSASDLRLKITYTTRKKTGSTCTEKTSDTVTKDTYSSSLMQHTLVS